MISIFNCLPRKTEGPIVQGARELFRDRKETLRQEIHLDSSSSSSAAVAAAAGDMEGGDIAVDDAASEVLADMRRQKIPIVKDSLKQRASQRPQGRFKGKSK